MIQVGQKLPEASLKEFIDTETEGYGSTARWSTAVEDEAEEEAREREALERAASWR